MIVQTIIGNAVNVVVVVDDDNDDVDDVVVVVSFFHSGLAFGVRIELLGCVVDYQNVLCGSKCSQPGIYTRRT